ncbi:hypothetical protein [Georgenia muralis]|uniref:Uncharacterized protein n=1 Tax=Georgenia muralis TaxID=154117 RepID=A0A3N4Z8I1_9MICO|nr:hypothetical protein [Georgenia muralis]RPF28324.1 hypothetical protein EDD32_2848 [Georgenia muralis]
MASRWVLVAVSAAQLAAGAAGQVIALSEGRAFDIDVLGFRGSPARLGRDSWLLGTGLSAPVLMLSVQAVATIRLAAGSSRGATRVLGSLGALMTCGYLIEKEARGALSPAGWNPTTTPAVAAGLTLAVTMAVLGPRQASSSS